MQLDKSLKRLTRAAHRVRLLPRPNMRPFRSPSLRSAGSSGWRRLNRAADDELVRSILAGEDDALAVLFDRYRRLVLSIGRQLLRDPAEAEDLTQQVFLEVYRAAAKFDASRGTVKMWILQHAYHLGLTRRRQLLGYQTRQHLGASRPSTATVAGVSGLHIYEGRRLVEQGLEQLTSAQRATVEMACFEGLSMREIADRRRESVGNVRHHYYRALERLRTWLSVPRRALGRAERAEEG